MIIDVKYSELDGSASLKPFPKEQLYKKGNICDHGLAINDAMVKNYTIIKPSAIDNITIKSITQ